MPTDLSPSSTVSALVLPTTGTHSDVIGSLAFGIYSSAPFVSGAVDQVSYVHGKLGGNVLDIELQPGNVYKAYEEACLEYSYIVNTHQAKNVLADMMGGATGTFNQDGEFSAYRDNTDIKPNMKFTKLTLEYARHVASSVASQIGLGQNERIYSASFDTVANQQDYDLQTLISASSEDGSAAGAAFTGAVGNNRILIEKVYYKTPAASWRFFGGGTYGMVGNLHSYGMYSDDSTFELVPVWQHELQASAYENNLKMRSSHYSYEIVNNRLRIFPIPNTASPLKFYVKFRLSSTEAYDEESDRGYGADGVNNMNTLPFPNVPYGNINSIGKQWIRRFALALCKETLGQIRSKLGSLPIPGNDVTLNGAALISEGKEEQNALREELKTVLDELTYVKLSEGDASLMNTVNETLQKVPYGIYVG
tara:strand:- start:78 stop:1340 length:1263 start_codon:yes stop_codon:yes gene_type:complete